MDDTRAADAYPLVADTAAGDAEVADAAAGNIAKAAAVITDAPKATRVFR